METWWPFRIALTPCFLLLKKLPANVAVCLEPWSERKGPNYQAGVYTSQRSSYSALSGICNIAFLPPLVIWDRKPPILEKCFPLWNTYPVNPFLFFSGDRNIITTFPHTDSVGHGNQVRSLLCGSGVLVSSVKWLRIEWLLLWWTLPSPLHRGPHLMHAKCLVYKCPIHIRDGLSKLELTKLNKTHCLIFVLHSMVTVMEMVLFLFFLVSSNISIHGIHQNKHKHLIKETLPKMLVHVEPVIHSNTSMYVEGLGLNGKLGSTVGSWTAMELGHHPSTRWKIRVRQNCWPSASLVPLHPWLQPTVDCVVLSYLLLKKKFVSGAVQFKPCCSRVNCKLVKLYLLHAARHYAVSYHGNGKAYVVLGLFCLKYCISS